MSKRPPFGFLVSVIVWALVVVAGMGEARAEGLKKASFRPHWVPQAQFAGYYTALAKGFYSEAGIDLEIRPGGPGIFALNNVAAGKETFGTEWLISGISMVSKGAPLVCISQMLQTGGLMLVAFKKSGIEDPKQMAGRKVGVWPGPFSIAPTLLFEQLGIRPKLVGQRFSIEDLLKGQLDVASAMIYNEYHVILESGVSASDLKVFFFRDYGLNFPEDGIYVRAETLKNDPELCAGFVKASLRGWIYAFDHPDEAVDIVMSAATEAKTGTTVEHQTTMLEEIKKMMLYRVSLDSMGELDPKDFDFVQKTLQNYNMIKNPVDFNEFYRPMYK